MPSHFRSYCVFVYGINIRRCPTFTHGEMQRRLADSGKNHFRVIGMGNRPDTLLIKAMGNDSATEVAKWVSESVGRPTVGRELDVLQALYPQALNLTKSRFGDRFDPKECVASIEGQRCKLGVVFASHGVSASVGLHDTTAVKVLGQFHDDTAMVLKLENAISGARIVWGKRTNEVVKRPWENILKHTVVCTSRSIAVIDKMLKLESLGSNE